MICYNCGRKIKPNELIICESNMSVKHMDCTWQGEWKENGGVDALVNCENRKSSFVFNDGIERL